MYNLIVADDEKIVLDGIVNIIPWRDVGIEVVGKASNGRELLKEAKEKEPDIILTDIRMPYLDGLDAVSLIREELPDTLFIIITAFEEFEYAKRAIEYGAVGFLTKPILKKEVIEQMKTTVKKLDERKSHREELMRMKHAMSHGAIAQVKREEPECPIDRAISYINNNLDRGLMLTEVAEYMHMNASYFSRYFKESFGMSYIDYLKQQKVKRAKELLATTNFKIYEISDQLGYNSIQYFSLLFKNSTGMTPQEYKNSIERKYY